MKSIFRKTAFATGTLGAIALGATLGQPLTGGPAGLVPVAAAQSSNDLNAAVKALRGISTMRANFTQSDQRGQTARGVMTLKRPGKIRFDYGKDADLLVVSNGKSLYMVDYEVRQVERWPIKNSPLGALLDPDRDMSKYGTLVPTTDNRVISIEVRDPKRPEFGVINLIFVRDPKAPGGLRLAQWVALDAQNYRTRVSLSNHRYGLSVSESTFKFKDPRRSSRRPS